MKLVVFVVAVVALGGLMVATGNLTFEFGSWSNPSASSHEPRSQTVREAFALLDGASVDEADLDIAQFTALVERVESDRDRASTRLFERELPSLARRLDRKFDRLARHVARVPVETRVGRACRAVTLRLLDRQRHAIRAFAGGIARHGATLAAIGRFTARWRRISAWYSSKFRPCAASASPADRAAIDAAIG